MVDKIKVTPTSLGLAIINQMETANFGLKTLNLIVQILILGTCITFTEDSFNLL